MEVDEKDELLGYLKIKMGQKYPDITANGEAEPSRTDIFIRDCLAAKALAELMESVGFNISVANKAAIAYAYADAIMEQGRCKIDRYV